MIITLDNVNIQLPFRWGQEDTLVNFELCTIPSHQLERDLSHRRNQLTFSVPFPNNSLRTQAILVFFPAPEGP